LNATSVPNADREGSEKSLKLNVKLLLSQPASLTPRVEAGNGKVCIGNV
jgi:hypothetical protein